MMVVYISLQTANKTTSMWKQPRYSTMVGKHKVGLGDAVTGNRIELVWISLQIRATIFNDLMARDAITVGRVFNWISDMNLVPAKHHSQCGAHFQQR